MTVSLLVLVQGYPSQRDRYNLAYVHTRLIQYQQAGYEVTVLNFGTNTSYSFEGISVLSENDWHKRRIKANLLISHAPNLRNHLRFLLTSGKSFPHWIFFFHGHEVLLKARYYPPPYSFVRQKGLLWRWLDLLYDHFKLSIWRQFMSVWLKQKRLNLVFVSQWMQNAFLACVGIDPAVIAPVSTVIPNSIHPIFLTHHWQPDVNQPFLADFVTIRPLDNSKYALDQVRELAMANPDLRFDVYGRGDFFRVYPPPPNLKWFDTYLRPEEMPTLLNRYRAALMPTRLDAQGVMMCELATFGIPLLTSDLPICHEMLGGFPRAGYLQEAVPLAEQLKAIESQLQTMDKLRFSPEETVGREQTLIDLLSVQPGLH